MKNLMRLFFLLAFLFGSFAFVACEDDDEDESTPTDNELVLVIAQNELNIA